MDRYRCRPVAFRRSVWCAPLMSFVAALILGCASVPQKNWTTEEHSRPEPRLILGPGDEVQISFFGAPELNTTQVVRRDGCVALRLIGDFRVEGKTPMALQKELSAIYAEQLQVREMAVEVKSSAPVFVSGAVKMRPEGGSRIVMERPMTALEAIMQAGGFDESQAQPRSVIVIRHEGEKWVGYPMDLSPALKGESGPSFYLKPFDIVYVPRTTVAKANQWVDQYINRMLPRLGLGYGTDGEITVYR
jgi:polysaccharide biosynthesis/export protein